MGHESSQHPFIYIKQPYHRHRDNTRDTKGSQVKTSFLNSSQQIGFDVI